MSFPSLKDQQPPLIYIYIYIVNFSETIHASFKSGCPVQSTSKMLNDWMFHHDHSLSLVFKNV